MDNNFDKTTTKASIIAIAIFVVLIVALVGLVIYGEQYTEYEFQLSEIQNDVYGTYNTVVSSIPAQNYDIITLCCNGQIRTFKGTVYITYTDSDPYVIYKDGNCVNADVIYVYVPFGSILYQGTTGIGSRR
jgi:hypothetical protein